MAEVDIETRQEEIHTKCWAICANAVDGTYKELFEPEFHDWIEPMLDEVEISKDGKAPAHPIRYRIGHGCSGVPEKSGYGMRARRPRIP